MKTATILALASSAIASVISLNSRDFAPKVKTRQAQTIEEGLNACEDKTIPCTIVAASEDKEMYGSKKPRDIADQLWEKCLANGCNIQGWDEDTQVAAGLGPTSATINVEAHGDWPPELRHALIWGMTELVGRTTVEHKDKEKRPIAKGDGGGYIVVDAWKAPKDFQINRYHWDDDHWESQGSISLSMQQEDGGEETCETLIGVLSDIASIFNGEIGSAIGSAEPACAAFS